MTGKVVAIETLAKPLKIGRLGARGRVFKSATSETLAEHDGRVSPALIDFYRPYAAAGTPLIVTGAMFVSAAGKAAERQLGIDDDGKLPGLAALVRAVREEAARHNHSVLLVAQLNHAGRQKIAPANAAVSASSVCERTLWTRPRAMADVEVDNFIEDFAQAARRARAAGFDGVELHAGHGYLINQFLSPMTNRRSGLYRCDPSGKTSALVDALMARVRQAVGDDFLVLVKLNGADRFFRMLRPWGPRLGVEESAAIAERFARAGADALTITVGHYESLLAAYRGDSWAFFRRYVKEGVGQDLPMPMRQVLRLSWPALALVGSLLWSRKEGFNLEYAEKVKGRLRQAGLNETAVICVGGFYRVREIARALETCDAVSIGRAMLAEPKLYTKLTGAAADDGACVHCNQCFALAGRHPARCYNDAVQAGLARTGQP